jgi:hypothetical protein
MNNFKSNRTESDNRLILVPEAFLNALEDKQNKILEALSVGKEKENITGDYISETLAKEKLGKKTTWFWEQRKNGTLPFVKVGGKVFYHKKHILNLFEQNKKGGHHDL